jgi:hypothetical protein
MNKWLIIGIVVVVIIGVIIALKYGKKSGELAAVKSQPGVFNPYELTSLSKSSSPIVANYGATMSDVKLK